MKHRSLKQKSEVAPSPRRTSKDLEDKAKGNIKEIYATLALPGDLGEIDRLIAEYDETQDHFSQLGFQVQPASIYVVDTNHVIRFWSFIRKRWIEPKVSAGIFMTYVVRTDITVDAAEDERGVRRKSEAQCGRAGC